MSEAHPGRGRFVAYLDGELGGRARRAFREHVRDCRRCRHRLERIRGEDEVFSAAAERLDRPMPEIPNPAESSPADDPRDAGSEGRGARRGGRRPLRAAAGVVLVLLGGFLLTPPGRALAERALSGIAGLFGGSGGGPAPTAAAPDTVRHPDQPAAVSVPARDGRLVVVLLAPEPASGPLRIRVGARGRAVVEGAVADVERGPGEVRVRAESLSALLVRLPDSVSSAEVRVNGRTVLRQDGREVRPLVPADTAAGNELVLRTGG